MDDKGRRRRVDFKRIADAARASAESIVTRWLPNGRREGAEWVSTNPTRVDHKPGSFKVNLRNGKWADFATDKRGGDIIGLAAHLHNLSQFDAAIRVAGMLGIDPYER